MPSWTNLRFHLSWHVLVNHVYSVRLKTLKSKYDQENKLFNIEEWKTENPKDPFFFMPSLDQSAQNCDQESV